MHTDSDLPRNRYQYIIDIIESYDDVEGAAIALRGKR